MKPEIRIALVKEVEHSKRVLSSEHANRWIWLGYFGAIVSNLVGLAFLTSTIAFIAGHHTTQLERILGSLQILVAMIFLLAPWYFLVRHAIYRKVQLMCEAILSVGQFDGYIAG